MEKTKKKLRKKGKKTRDAIIETEVRNLISKIIMNFQPLYVNENYSNKFILGVYSSFPICCTKFLYTHTHTHSYTHTQSLCLHFFSYSVLPIVLVHPPVSLSYKVEIGISVLYHVSRDETNLQTETFVNIRPINFTLTPVYRQHGDISKGFKAFSKVVIFVP